MTQQKPNFGALLPPAGHQRDEELKRRTDVLEEQAETQYADKGAIPHDSPVLDPEQNREIQQNIAKDRLAIGVNHPYYKTKWVYCGERDSSLTKVWEEKAKGWMVATVKEFPEAIDLVKADNTIRIGDVILMFMRIDEHVKLEQRERDKRLKQQFGVEAEIHDLAAKHSGVFAGASTPELGESGHISQRTRDAVSGMTARRAATRRVAARHLGNRMKKGPLPGVPIK